MNCPRCDTELRITHGKGGRMMHCDDCDGFAVTVELLRRIAPKPRIDAIWSQAANPEAEGELACPECARALSSTSTPGGARTIALDVCRRCHIVWFDAQELAAFAPLSPEAPIEHDAAGYTHATPPASDQVWRVMGTLERLFA